MLASSAPHSIKAITPIPTGLHYREYFDVQNLSTTTSYGYLPKIQTASPCTCLYKPREGKLTYGPVWDFDRTQVATMMVAPENLLVGTPQVE